MFYVPSENELMVIVSTKRYLLENLFESIEYRPDTFF